MTNFSELISKRRSIRNFTEQQLDNSQVELILKAGLKAPSSKNKRPWHFLVTENKETLNKLSNCKETGSKPIENSVLAIIILGDPLISDIWIEDTSIASIMMQLQAEDLGIGSCWIQIRNRETVNGTPSEEYIKDLLNLPMQMQVLAILAFGHKTSEKPPFDEDKLLWEKVHIENF